MPSMRHIVLAAIVILTTGLTAAHGAAQAGPNVVTTIKPIHSLVAAVMGDTGTPYLIVKGAGSPHTYALKPSDAAALQSADLIFRDATNFENFLNKAVDTLPEKARVVVLADTPGITRRHMRATGDFELDEDELPSEDADPALSLDPHLWLDPQNAIAMVKAIAEALADIDPANGATYAANAHAEIERLSALQSQLASELVAAKGKPYIVFHDAYQYFEHRFGLSAAGSIVIEPDSPPGARRIAGMRDKITRIDATCVFSEPEFEPKLVATVIEGTSARTGVLDPLGANLPDGPDLYFTLMQNLAKSLTDCLAPAS